MIRKKCTKYIQRQWKLPVDTERRGTIFVFGEISFAKKITVPSGEYSRHSVKKDKREIKKPRKQNRHILHNKELNAEKLKRSQRKKKSGKRHEQDEQGSTIEALILNERQKPKLSGQPN